VKSTPKQVTDGPNLMVTTEHFHADVTVGNHGSYDADVTIYERSIEDNIVTGVRHVFLTARELCCCPPTGKQVSPSDKSGKTWVSYETDVSAKKYMAKSGLMSRDDFVETRQIAATIRGEMLRSFTSSRRHPAGEFMYVDSEAFHGRVTDLMRMSARREFLEQSISTVDGISDLTRGRLYAAFGDVTLDEVLDTDGGVLARALESDLSEAISLKQDLIRAVAAHPPRRPVRSTVARRE